jgi:hypothetical protein
MSRKTTIAITSTTTTPMAMKMGVLDFAATGGAAGCAPGAGAKTEGEPGAGMDGAAIIFVYSLGPAEKLG